jgi:hypothetical protein
LNWCVKYQHSHSSRKITGDSYPVSPLSASQNSKLRLSRGIASVTVQTHWASKFVRSMQTDSPSCKV